METKQASEKNPKGKLLLGIHAGSDTSSMKTRNPEHITLIRPATGEDIPTIIELSKAGIQRWASELGPALNEWIESVCTTEYFAGMIADPQKTLLVAEYDGKISGTAYGYPSSGRFHTGGLYLSVNGQGVASKLIGELIKEARRLGLNELLSEVYENNHAALRFLRRHGWVHKKTEPYEGINFHQKVLVLS